jgi:hypothetical protein
VIETVSTPYSPDSKPVPLTTPSLVTISQERVTDTVKHNEPLCPFAAEPFEGALIDGEGRIQLLASSVPGYKQRSTSSQSPHYQLLGIPIGSRNKQTPVINKTYKMRVSLQSSLFATMLLLAGFAAAAPVGNSGNDEVSRTLYPTSYHHLRP